MVATIFSVQSPHIVLMVVYNFHIKLFPGESRLRVVHEAFLFFPLWTHNSEIWVQLIDGYLACATFHSSTRVISFNNLLMYALYIEIFAYLFINLCH